MSKELNPNKPVPILPNTAEVVGEGDLINGVFGSSKKQTGVVGQSETFVGVSGDGKQVGVNGTSRTGTGVLGESDSGDGIGVHGKGGRFAGLFEGKVQVTESLTVQGLDLVTLIQQLQQRIEHLEASTLTRGGVPVHRTEKRPNIILTELHLLAAGGGIFTVTGSGFKPSGRITFNIFNTTSKSTVPLLSNIGAKGDGTLVAREQIPCKLGDMLSFAASDGTSDSSDLTGTLWSNTETGSVLS